MDEAVFAGLVDVEFMMRVLNGRDAQAPRGEAGGTGASAAPLSKQKRPVDSLHRATRIVLGRSTVRRFRGEQYARTVDEVPCATSRGS